VMRHDELRVVMHGYFKRALAARIDQIGANGLQSELDLAPQATTQMLAEGTSEDYWGIMAPHGTDAFLRRLCEATGLSGPGSTKEADRVLQEYKLAHRDFLRALVKHQASLEHYDFTGSMAPVLQAPAPEAPADLGIALQTAIDDYVAENKRAGSWQSATFEKKEANLALLTEYFGADRLVVEITKRDAQDIKRVLLELPANRHKMPQTRTLSVREATKVTGLAKISAVTVNGYISTFQSFFEWAMKNGHVEGNLFAGTRVGKFNSKAVPKRQAYKPDALKAVYREVTENSLGLVKAESHKWATLIAMFTGARLNEICQLEVADIQQQDGIWFFHLIDEGDSNKKFKSAAALRKVPMHNELVQLGLLDYRSRMEAQRKTRMFPDYTFCAKNGYGRALGRWFNATLTPVLGIKSTGHVFHGLRHTMVTRLAQAGVAEPIYQSIVGHERQGVTQQVYMREGYTLAQLKAAIDLFSV
jgi:integrase